MNAKLSANWNSVFSRARTIQAMVGLGYNNDFQPIPTGFHITADYLANLTAKIINLAVYFLDPATPFETVPYTEQFTERVLGTYPGAYIWLDTTLPLTNDCRILRTAARTGIALPQLDTYLDAAAAILDRMHLRPVTSNGNILPYPTGVTSTVTTWNYSGDWTRGTGTLADALAAMFQNGQSTFTDGVGAQTQTAISGSYYDNGQFQQFWLTGSRSYTTLTGTTYPCTVHVYHAIMEGAVYTSAYPYLHNYPTAPPYPATVLCARNAGGYLDYSLNGDVVTSYSLAHVNLGAYTDGMTYAYTAAPTPAPAMVSDAENYTFTDSPNVSEWSSGWHLERPPVIILDYAT